MHKPLPVARAFYFLPTFQASFRAILKAVKTNVDSFHILQSQNGRSPFFVRGKPGLVALMIPHPVAPDRKMQLVGKEKKMRAYSYRDAVELGLEPQEYTFINEAMTAEAVLHFKVWGKKWNLQCYFQNIRTGEQFILSAFCGSTKQYTSRDKGIDFSEPDIENSLYQVTTAPNSKGKIAWESATLLIPAERREDIEARIAEVYQG